MLKFDNRDAYFTISNEELKTGMLKQSECREKLLKNWSKKGKEEELSVKVLLIPKIVSDMIPKYESPAIKKREEIWEFKRASLVYIKAQVSRETFQLSNIRGESLVWSDLLIKRYGNKILALFHRIINKIFRKDDVNAKFYLKDGSSIKCGENCWQQYMSQVYKHFEKRTGKGLFSCDNLVDDYGINHNLYVEDRVGEVIVIKDETVFAARHIVSLLNEIVNNPDKRLSLFKNMVIGKDVRKRNNEHRVGKNVEKHLGQMKNDFPLANAQRDAVHCFSDMGNGEVLAVSGPPGTGKTTMLQSIVADMVVRSIVNYEENVPFILASSSNNKAITNIIDAFSSGKEDISIIDLYHRWLCYETGEGERFVPMAVYCPSASVDKQKLKEYFVTDTNGSLDYASLRDRYYRDSSDFYIRASAVFGFKIESLEEIRGVIGSRIRSIKGELDEIGKIINDKKVPCGKLKDIAVGLALRYNRKFEFQSDSILNEGSDSRRKCE